MEGMKRINTARSPKTPRGHGSPTFQQLLHEDHSNSSINSSVVVKDQDQEDHQHKKSVLTKVKEKAKKLKHSLSKKKHDHDDIGSPSSAVALEDDENDDNAPKYHGAPMYESEQALGAGKETIMEQPRANPIGPEKHVLTGSSTAPTKNLGDEIMNKYKAKKAQMSQNNGAVTKPEAGPVSDDAKIDTFGQSGETTWDKGVSVKEYLMQKLEPGENDRALSQMITEAMSPRKTVGREMGVVEMVKEAVTSLLQNEEEAASITSSSPPIPLSTNPQQVTELIEENHGRILQTN